MHQQQQSHHLHQQQQSQNHLANNRNIENGAYAASLNTSYFMPNQKSNHLLVKSEWERNSTSPTPLANHLLVNDQNSFLAQQLHHQQQQQQNHQLAHHHLNQHNQLVDPAALVAAAAAAKYSTFQNVTSVQSGQFKNPYSYDLINNFK